MCLCLASYFRSSPSRAWLLWTCCVVEVKGWQQDCLQDCPAGLHAEMEPPLHGGEIFNFQIHILKSDFNSHNQLVMCMEQAKSTESCRLSAVWDIRLKRLLSMSMFVSTLKLWHAALIEPDLHYAIPANEDLLWSASPPSCEMMCEAYDERLHLCQKCVKLAFCLL